MTLNMIDLQSFSVRYNSTGLFAIKEIYLQLKQGQCLLITGPTGCGKTTLLRTLAGLLNRDNNVMISGQALVKGTELERINRSEFAPRVGILFQNPDDQITGHTPREEIAFGLENLGYCAEEVDDKVESALAEIELQAKADNPIDTLSGGQKQRVAAAAVLAMHPDLLLLDEPVSNLDWRGRKRLADLLSRLKSRGMTIVVCSHETDDLLSIADMVIRLESGEIVEEGTTKIRNNDSSSKSSGFSSKDFGQTIVEVENLQSRYGKNGFVLGPLSFSVHGGEIVALLGPNGGGKTTLISLLAGILKPENGSIKYLGKRLRRFDKKLLHSIGYIAQNSDLMLHHDSVVRELKSRPRHLGVNTDLNILAGESLHLFNLEEFSDRHPFSLSQGQRQRLALAAATTGGADLVLIDEPTTGQDNRQIGMLQGRLRKLAEDGAAIVFSSHNLRAVAEFATRVIVISDGKIRFDGKLAGLLGMNNLLEEISFPSEGGSI